ncbi:MAG: hypothetical protein Q9162_006882 [Coniocarpon cinnabarinum]
MEQALSVHLRAPGTILNSRQISPAVGGSTNTYQLLYRSTDSKGNPNAVVTTIFEPEVADPKKLLSVQEPYGYYTFQTGGDVSADSFIASGLADGWYVASPDFEGFNAAFTNGLQSGQATLDGLRAALNSNSITGIDSDAAYAIGGYSGGALGSEWAVELQPKYAPELKIAGAALGGLTPNVTSVLFTISGTAFAGLGPAGILGLSAQDPDFRAYVESLLVPANATTFEKALTQCLTDDIATFLGQDITNYFVGGAATLDNMNVTDFTEQYGIMGLRDTPTVPLYVYKGVQDQISVIADTDALVNKYCATGASITYSRNSTTDHVSEAAAGQDAAFAFLQDRINGVPAAPGCTTTTV